MVWKGIRVKVRDGTGLGIWLGIGLGIENPFTPTDA